MCNLWNLLYCTYIVLHALHSLLSLLCDWLRKPKKCIQGLGWLVGRVVLQPRLDVEKTGKLTVFQLSVCWVWIWDGKAWSIKLCCICAQQWEEQRQWHTLANHVVLLGVKTNKQQTFIIMLHISFSKQYSITLHRNGLFLTQTGYSIYIHTHIFFLCT